ADGSGEADRAVPATELRDTTNRRHHRRSEGVHGALHRSPESENRSQRRADRIHLRGKRTVDRAHGWQVRTEKLEPGHQEVHMRRAAVVITSIVVLGAAGIALAQEGRGRGAGPARRPPLFFREEWGQTEKGGEHPTGPESVTSPNLELKLYGPTGKEVLLTGA